MVRSGLQVPPVGLQRRLHGRLQRNDGPAKLLVARAGPRPARHGDVAGVPHEGGAGSGCSGAEPCYSIAANGGVERWTKVVQSKATQEKLSYSCPGFTSVPHLLPYPDIHFGFTVKLV